MTYERETTSAAWTRSRWNDGYISKIQWQLSSSGLSLLSAPRGMPLPGVPPAASPPSIASISRPRCRRHPCAVGSGSRLITGEPRPGTVFVQLRALAATPTAYKRDGPALQPARSTGCLLLLRQLFGGAVHMVEEVGDGHQREHAAKDTGGPRCQDEAIGEARGDPRSQAPGAGQ